MGGDERGVGAVGFGIVELRNGRRVRGEEVFHRDSGEQCSAEKQHRDGFISGEPQAISDEFWDLQGVPPV